MPENRMQFSVLAALVAINAFLAFLVFQLGLFQNYSGQFDLSSLPDVPNWLLGLINAAIIVVLYGGLGFLGYWLARKLGLPGIFRKNNSWKNWFLLPLILGVVVGIFMVATDKLLAIASNWNGFPHPAFPMSLIASATAGIGEEILYRGFFLTLWAFLLSRIFRKQSQQSTVLWVANIFAAIVFAAAHIPGTMMLLKIQTISGIPAPALIELFLLNGIVGVVAGDRYIKDGLVSAIGVHFWVDIVWHVLYPSIF